MIGRLLRPLPNDAQCVVAVAALMPIGLHLYHAAPWVADLLRLEDVRAVARALFSLSFAVGAFLVAHLIRIGGPRADEQSERHQQWRVFMADAIAASGITLSMMAILSLQEGLMTQERQTMTWRMLTGMAQAILVSAWVVLWRIRSSWLSHNSAALAALASGVGLAIYVVANFLVEDPLTSAWGWGVIHPQSLVARITGSNIIEPMIATLLWVALYLQVRRYLKRTQGGGA